MDANVQSNYYRSSDSHSEKRRPSVFLCPDRNSIGVGIEAYSIVDIYGFGVSDPHEYELLSAPLFYKYVPPDRVDFLRRCR